MLAIRRATKRDAGSTPIVVSANPGSAMHLGAAGLIVRHPTELIAEALEDTGA